MSAVHNAYLAKETRLLNACLAELAHADCLGDEVRRFYAVGEIASFALHSEASEIRTLAETAMKKSAAKAKRARKGVDEAFRLKAASRSPALPRNCLVSLDADGELVVREI